MDDNVTRIRQFHETRNFGGREKLRRQEAIVAELYRSLSTREIERLARPAIDQCTADPDGTGVEILYQLACLRPGALIPFHEELIEHGIFYPALMFYGAESSIAVRLINLLPGDCPAFVLSALAWVGGPLVQDAFHRWMTEPPAWASRLFVPPHRFPREAGWELTETGGRRDLFVRECRPLVVPRDGTRSRGVPVYADHEESCGWCRRPMATLLELDFSSGKLRVLGPAGRTLRIATCLACTGVGTVFTRIDRDGLSTWHPANQKPSYLPDPPADWPPLPAGQLVLDHQPRHWMEAADWVVRGVRYSQVGGYPTWIQNAEYPDCPDCRRPMPFVGQVSVEDLIEYGEGIYHAYTCIECGVAATGYQQS